MTDFALLDFAFSERIPVLAICYGIQSLNVYLGGSLIQHISAKDPSSEVRTSIPHAESEQQSKEFSHAIDIEADSRLAKLAGTTEVQVNSSHHQAILDPGRNLRIVARAPDGVIEAVEWTGDSNWVMGVQWHPERMVEKDSVAQALFRNLIAAARREPIRA